MLRRQASALPLPSAIGRGQRAARRAHQRAEGLRAAPARAIGAARCVDPDHAGLSTCADRAWPQAGRAFLSAFELPLPEGTSPDVVRPLLIATISALVEQEIKPEDCGTIDEFYSALEPLPPENVGKLLVAFLKLGENDRKPGQAKTNPFTICEGPNQ